MRILIASDLHGSLDSLRFLIDRARRIQPDLIALLGDLVYHGPRNPLPRGYDTVSMLTDMPSLSALPHPLTVVRGNCDAEVDVEQMPFPMPENAWIEADGLNIFVSHGHHLPEKPHFATLPPGTVILRGHTHIPRAESVAGYHIWNPGSLSLPKGGFPATYGIYENGVFRVLDLDGREIMRNQPNV